MYDLNGEISIFLLPMAWKAMLHRHHKDSCKSFGKAFIPCKLEILMGMPEFRQLEHMIFVITSVQSSVMLEGKPPPMAVADLGI